ncbi:MAG: hypothetical protein AAF383_12915 [Cyanobacteria bacterium P01_A01_bin.83]
MLEGFEEIEAVKENSNYPADVDTSFTPDEQESIIAYKRKLNRKLDKNQSVLKGLEISFWGITSYSLARFLILTSGTGGIPLAVSSILIINQITNREAIEDLINCRSEDKSDLMGRIIKFGFSTVVTAFLMWGALGEFLSIVNSSKDTYNQLQTATREFNQLPSNHQNAIYIALGLLGIGGFYVLIDSRRR